MTTRITSTAGNLAFGANDNSRQPLSGTFDACSGASGQSTAAKPTISVELRDVCLACYLQRHSVDDTTQVLVGVPVDRDTTNADLALAASWEWHSVGGCLTAPADIELEDIRAAVLLEASNGQWGDAWAHIVIPDDEEDDCGEPCMAWLVITVEPDLEEHDAAPAADPYGRQVVDGTW